MVHWVTEQGERSLPSTVYIMSIPTSLPEHTVQNTSSFFSEHSCFSYLKAWAGGTGKLPQWLRTLYDLTDNFGSDSSTQILAHNNP